MEQPGYANVLLRCFMFYIPTLLHSLQHLSQRGEGGYRVENQEDVECEMKSRDRVKSRGWGGEAEHALGGWEMALEAWFKTM